MMKTTTRKVNFDITGLDDHAFYKYEAAGYSKPRISQMTFYSQECLDFDVYNMKKSPNGQFSIVDGHCEFSPEIAVVKGSVITSEITSVNLDKIKYLGFGVFKGSKLKSVSSNELMTIDRGVFAGCADLKEVSFPNVEDVERSAFCGTSVVTMELGTHTCVAIGTFLGCDSLETIVLVQSDLEPCPTPVTFPIIDYAGATKFPDHFPKSLKSIEIRPKA